MQNQERVSETIVEKEQASVKNINGGKRRARESERLNPKSKE